MSTTILSNIRTRLRLIPQSAGQVLTRLRMRAQNNRDSTLRLVLAIYPAILRDEQARLRLKGLQSGSLLKLRLRVFVSTQRDSMARVRLAAMTSKNMRWRLRLFTQINPLLIVRLNVHAPTAIPNPVVAPLPASLTAGLFLGKGQALPLLPPALPYQLNGIVLDTPVVCSAPSSTGLLVVGGSSFTLAFQSPSVSTQNQLVSGLATMTFALVTGEMVTGPVLLQVTSSGSITVVNVVTQADIWVNRWVVSSQFA